MPYSAGQHRVLVRARDEVALRLADPGGTVHLIGVGGVGMAGVACHLQGRGFRVTGSDAAASAVTGWLAARGVLVHLAHDAEWINADTQWVVRTPAVPEDNAELVRARSLGLPVFTRGVVLPALLHGYQSVAVCGSHGKTTSSAMIVHMLRAAGGDPSFCVGGETAPDGAVAAVGTDSVMVVEADESDGTLAVYEPEHTVITGIDFDHMEHFEDEDAFVDCFRQVVRATRNRVAYHAEDRLACSVAARRPGSVSYALGGDASIDVGGVIRELTGSGARFDLYFHGRRHRTVELAVPGLHNVLDALAAVSALVQLGVDPRAADALSFFKPVRRRFELIYQDEDVAVVSDYAHHPTEIRAAVEAARLAGRDRLIVLFQPHRYTRTLALRDAFPPAFAGADEVILAPVYPASEAPLPGGASRDLLASFRDQGVDHVSLADSLPHAERLCWSKLGPGAMLFIVGAGDVEQVAYAIGGRLRHRDI